MEAPELWHLQVTTTQSNPSGENMQPFTTENVQEALTALGIATEIHIFTESTATASEAAAAIGTELGSIVKSLCFVIAETPVVILTAGDQRVDDRKLGSLYEVSRKKVKIADSETTVQETGYLPGGVPPIGHRKSIPVLIDSTLQRYETVYAAAGTANSIFPIALETLIAATNGKVVDIAKDSGHDA